MQVGPVIISKCMHCGERMAQWSLMSGNTVGARFWTDGKCEAPMLPHIERLAQCHACNTILWLDELETVDEIFPEEFFLTDEPDVDNPQFVEKPSAQVCLTAAQSAEDAEKERYARMRAWWLGNDARREDEPDKPLSEWEQDNLQRLLPLLDEGETTQRIQKAEAFRELGMFSETRALLSCPVEPEYEGVVSTIRDLADRGVQAVQQYGPD